MRYLRQKKPRSDEINIGPLIDLVFILLIFFAVSTTFVKDMKIDLDRPQASRPEKASAKSARVYIGRGGSIYVNEQPVKVWMLQSRVRDMLAVTSNKNVLVVTDGQVTSERLIEVVDQCKLGGAKEVAVAAEQAN
jgi:biopolymer transport protein ExbD